MQHDVIAQFDVGLEGHQETAEGDDLTLIHRNLFDVWKLEDQPSEQAQERGVHKTLLSFSTAATQVEPMFGWPWGAILR